MPDLTQERLFESHVPASWAPLLETLAQIERIAFDETTETTARENRFAALRQRLLDTTEELVGELPGEYAVPARIEEQFCRAVLVWMMYARSGARLIYSTLDSETLPHFEPDLPDDPGAHETVLAALTRAFDFDREQLAGWQKELRARASNLELKKAIVSSLVEELRAGEARHASVQELFSAIYGPWPFRPHDIDVFVTEATVVFVAPYKDGKLTGPDYVQRPFGERTLIKTFLEKLESGAWRTDRFPGFGVLDRSSIDESLLDQLHEKISSLPSFATLRRDALRDTLHTMITFLPRDTFEAYLIHDLWGHTWQETLADFEWDYYQLERVVNEPIQLNTGSRDTQGTRRFPSLGEAFSVRDGTVILDEVHAAKAMRRELETRVGLSLNAILAEALADITEYKYEHDERRRGASLPSSALLSAPVKHDLMVRDVSFHFQRWRQSFRAFIDDASVRAQFCGALAVELECSVGLYEAVEKLGGIARDQLEYTALSSRRSFVVKRGQIAIDIVERTQAAFARLDRDLSDFIERGESSLEQLRFQDPTMPRWRCPSACTDLLVITLGCFYEHDRETLFWHLDELLRDYCPELFRRLDEALSGAA